LAPFPPSATPVNNRLADIGLDENSVCAALIPFFHIAGVGLLLAANLNGASGTAIRTTSPSTRTGSCAGCSADRQDDERGSVLPDINLVPGQQVATLP